MLSKYENSVVATWLAQVSRFRFFGLLLALIGWSLCIMSTAGTQWRVWHIERKPGITSDRLWIGIWRVCFIQDDPIDHSIDLHCEEFTEEYRTLPKEIFVAQDLMSLAAILQSLAISFMTFAVFKGAKQKKALLPFFTIGGILNLISGIITLVPISWNLYSVLKKKGIEFPEFFVLPLSPKEQYAGSAIYMGYVASTFLLSSGIVILSKTCWRSRKIDPLIMMTDDPLAMSSSPHKKEPCLNTEACMPIETST